MIKCCKCGKKLGEFHECMKFTVNESKESKISFGGFYDYIKEKNGICFCYECIINKLTI